MDRHDPGSPLPCQKTISERMPRFVLLFHETPPHFARGAHYDLMLEHESVLWTWTLATPPDEISEQVAERIDDHRIAYLDFEGSLTGDRGQVTRIDAGEFTFVHCAANRIEFALAGERLQGTATLVQEADQRWRLSFDSRD